MIRKAISIRQPYLWLITRPDIIGDDARREAYLRKEIKDVENRSREIQFQGEVFLHASQTPADNYNTLRLQILRDHNITCPDFDALPQGGICGRAMFELPVDESPSPWFTGRYAYPIFSAESIRFVKCKGTVTPLFWNVPEELRLTI